MRFRRILRAILVMAAAAAPLAAGARPAEYKSAIAVDAATGAILYSENADAVSPPASMTKLMTFAVLDDILREGRITLSTPVTATAEDARVGATRDSTVVWLRQGETFTVDELIYAMMIQSANDAANALAHASAGTVPAFVALMNVKARELGMLSSTFRTPNGFPVRGRRVSEGDLTSPRDYSLLCRYLLLHTDILRYTSVRSRTFGAGVRLNPTRMTNHNNLLGRVEGVDGLKTGFTNGAGFCLSATAERNGHRVIVIMMGSPDQRSRDRAVVGLIRESLLRIPITEPPFQRAEGGRDGAPAPARLAVPAAPTRPSPDPDQPPVITLPKGIR
ncbi:MAG TPA: D-alanyl-D-alanine carboxypeptidase family protein [Opitutaceae bacterium]|jgi:D-alanyl-D-alanine carboxypeptidase (penicillin-binding protein 5/6)